MVLLDISDETLKKVFAENELYLPIRWDGENFYEDLKSKLDKYRGAIKNKNLNRDLVQSISTISDLLLSSVEVYQDGFPSDSYAKFDELIVVDLLK